MCFSTGPSAEDIYKKRKSELPKFELPSLAVQKKTGDRKRQLKDVQRKGQQARSMLYPTGGNNAS